MFFSFSLLNFQSTKLFYRTSGGIKSERFFFITMLHDEPDAGLVAVGCQEMEQVAESVTGSSFA